MSFGVPTFDGRTRCGELVVTVWCDLLARPVNRSQLYRRKKYEEKFMPCLMAETLGFVVHEHREIQRKKAAAEEDSDYEFLTGSVVCDYWNTCRLKVMTVIDILDLRLYYSFAAINLFNQDNCNCYINYNIPNYHY